MKILRLFYDNFVKFLKILVGTQVGTNKDIIWNTFLRIIKISQLIHEKSKF